MNSPPLRHRCHAVTCHASPVERMTAPSPDTALDAIRREIDLIDDQILELLERRFAATQRVKATKANDGSIASSPFRPAREAAMMRRLLAQRGAAVSPDVLVRLWRVILSASTELQAPVTLHVDEVIGKDSDIRLLIGQHFCGMKLAVHGSPAAALDTLRTARGDLAIIASRSGWATAFSPAEEGCPRVIGTLPVLTGGNPPALLVFGHAEPQPSGDDETLVLCPGDAVVGSPALWQVVSGRNTLVSLPGFLGADDPLLREFVARFPGAAVAGRCPRPIKVAT